MSLASYFDLLIFASFSLGEFGIFQSVFCLLVSGPYQNSHILSHDIIKKVSFSLNFVPKVSANLFSPHAWVLSFWHHLNANFFKIYV
jgi:hypothetical protein